MIRHDNRLDALRYVAPAVSARPKLTWWKRLLNWTANKLKDFSCYLEANRGKV